jgi:hypothetical protein
MGRTVSGDPIDHIYLDARPDQDPAYHQRCGNDNRCREFWIRHHEFWTRQLRYSCFSHL